jgi:hypothetical protein
MLPLSTHLFSHWSIPLRDSRIILKAFTILSLMVLKVHKNENFFGFDFEFCTISMLVMHKNEDFKEKFFLLDHYDGGSYDYSP